MAFNFTATGTALTPRSALFDYIRSIRNYAYSTVSSGVDVSLISGFNYPIRNTFFVRRQQTSAGAALNGLTGGSGSISQFPLLVNSGLNYDSITTPPVLYINLGNVSDIINNSDGGVYEMVYNPTKTGTEQARWERDDITPYTDWKYIASVTWYDNSNNGSYDVFYPRQPLSGTQSWYDVVLPFYQTSWTRVISGKLQRYDSDITGTVCLSGNVNMYNTMSISVDNAPFMPYFARTVTTPAAYGVTIQSLRSNPTQSDKYTIFPDEQTIANFFALWGINVFFTVNKAETENTPIIGQPDNPNPNEIPSGTGDNSSDNITYPVITTEPNAFYKRVFLDPENVDKLKSYLFSSNFLSDFPNGIGRLWNDPMQSIIGLTWYPINPVHVHNIVIREADEPITIGNLTDIQAVVGYPFVSSSVNNTPYIDMGSYTVEPYFGRYLDYDGYTSISIYLPYIGERQLITSEVMGKTLKVIYYPDFVNNTFLAVVYADGQPIAQHTASFGVQIPLGGSAHNDYLISVISGVAATALTVGATVATGGGAAMAAIGAAGGALKTATTQEHVKQVGAFTPNTGIYAPQYPYLIISRPYMSRPASWETLHGNAAGYSTIVGNCTGYIEAEEVQLLSNEIMTAEEQNEIENLLKGGIYA